MTREETSGCISLMATLWSSYRPPQSAEDMAVLVNTWQQFFGKVDAGTVTRTIYEISAEGAEFAPQVGQIYARLKENRAVARLVRPDVQKLDRWYRAHCERFAAVGVPTAIEAKRQGIPDAEWCRMAEEAGL